MNNNKGNINILLILGAGAEKNLIRTNGKYEGMPLAKEVLYEVIQFESRFESREKKKIGAIIKDIVGYTGNYLSTISKRKFSTSKIFDLEDIDSSIEELIKLSNQLIEDYMKKNKNNLDDSNKLLLKNLKNKINNNITGNLEEIKRILRDLEEEFIKRKLDYRLIRTIRHIVILIVTSKELDNINKIVRIDDNIRGLFKDAGVNVENINELIEPSSIIKNIAHNVKKYLQEYGYQELIDFEQLLIEEFSKFYSEQQLHSTQQRSNVQSRYMYISWLMWAYFKEKELKLKSQVQNFPNIYKELLKFTSRYTNVKIITFNYTSFVDSIIKNKSIIHFHGTLNEYINTKSMRLMKIKPNSKKTEPIKIVFDTLENIKVESGENVFIPGFIPPLKFKPVVSREFLQNWCKANEWVNEADIIIVIGYSFAHSDEHFNDLIRKWYHNKKNTKLILIGPHRDSIKKNIMNLFGNSIDSEIVVIDKINKTEQVLEKRIIIFEKGAEGINSGEIIDIIDAVKNDD